MKFVSKTATEPVYRNALFQTCAMRMKSNAAKQISQLVYGPIVLEMIFVFQMTANVILYFLFFFICNRFDISIAS